MRIGTETCLQYERQNCTSSTAATEKLEQADFQRAPLVKVKRLSVHFGGVRALDDVSLETFPAKIFGLIGPNGTGKTTLFNCLSRIYEWTSGTIEWEGTDLSRVPRHQLAALGVGR